ncbi:hypothetical protein [Cellulomonas sp. S1-8]|uniref:hypothetical protein n=1 Tax=Cellulomonas sp. S1-8 TaxID=2904790 RepID=UPI002242E0D2|nr:hypothetical protein [Cellulomonas sp. S1-8]UZN04245.1 hypothetical protein OKX07_04720 [Cellulomonas sp. S1-8]
MGRFRATTSCTSARRVVIGLLASVLVATSTSATAAATSSTAGETSRVDLGRLLVPRLVDLGVPAATSSASYVTESGFVVGTSADHGASPRIFRWKGGRTTFLPGDVVWHHLVDVNERGQVLVDGSRDGRHVALLWQPDGTVVDLFPDLEWASGRDLNNLGVVAAGVSVDGEQRAMTWDDGRVRDLGAVGPGTDVSKVNDAGVVIGSAYLPDRSSRAYVWRDGALSLLPVPDGVTSTAFLVNERGDVVGSVDGLSPDHGRFPQNVVWERGETLRDLATPGLSVVALNERGVMAGYRNRALTEDAPHHPVVVDHRGVTDLRTPRGGPGAATALNDLGVVVGSEVRGTDRSQAVAWVLGFPIELGGPTGRPLPRWSSVADVTNRGRAVGAAELPTDGGTSLRAVMWDLVPTKKQIEAVLP